MRFRKLLPLLTAALTGALVAGYWQTDPARGRALASPMVVPQKSGGIVAVSTNANDRNGNRLILVDTGARKQILVYRMRGGEMRLIAVRPYLQDLEWRITPDANGNGFSYEYAKVQAERIRKERLKAGKKWAPVGTEMVLTSDSDNSEGRNRLILINRELKTILVYRLNSNAIWLTSARPYDYDQELLYTREGACLSYEESRNAVKQAQRVKEIRRRRNAGL